MSDVPKGPSAKLRPLEFRVFRDASLSWSANSTADENGEAFARRVLAMVSGGADSMAMLRVLFKLRDKLGFELEILHAHHGDDDERGGWRNQAARLVQDFARENGLVIHMRKSEVALSSEADFRRFRWEAIQSVWTSAKQNGASITCVAFAHHRDDLLETRLIRLLRGTGAQGLRAMRPWGLVRGIPVWRPFLTTDRRDLQRYLEECGARAGVDWVDDPSNQDAKYLRNAIRHQLLPQIEAIRQGGVAAITRSLEVIVEEISDGPVEEKVPLEPASPAKLSRRDLMSLSPEKQRARLGQWLKQRGVESYSQAHIKEVLKRLDSDQRRLSFEVCGRVWLVDEMVEIVALPQQGQ